MTDLTQPTRREFLKIGGVALAALPVIGLSTGAMAAQNEAVRKAMSYQATPKDGLNCAGCVNFKAPNACTLFPGDDEIAATGYCLGFVAKPKP